MHKAESVNKNKSAKHLKLVSTVSKLPTVAQPPSCSAKPIDCNEIKFLTQAMMNRLWIPRTSSIVGLLNVGRTRDNFEELSKWIVIEQINACNECVSDGLKHLERRFRDSVSCYPEY